MVRPSPVEAKENPLPRASSPIKKKARQSLSKRVSFGHVDIHTFLKDADRTPSPMPPLQSASSQAAGLAEANGQGGTPASVVVPFPDLASGVASQARTPALAQQLDMVADRPPQLADLLRDEDEAVGRRAPGAPADDDDDDVVFQPRSLAEGVAMELTGSYGAGIREVSEPQMASPMNDSTEAMDFTQSYGVGILSVGGLDPMDEDCEPPPTASLHEAELAARPEARAPATAAAEGPARASLTDSLPDSLPSGGAALSYDQFLASHGVRFLDETAGHQRQPSLCPVAEGLVPFPLEAQREEALVFAAACVRLEMENAQWGAEQLAASCAQIRSAIALTEEQVQEGAPNFFSELSASPIDLQGLKALCRNCALSMWHEWRTKLEASYAQVLSEADAHLIADHSRLQSLLATMRDMHERARAAQPGASQAKATQTERALAEARADVARRRAALAAATKRVADATASSGALKVRLEPAAHARSQSSELQAAVHSLGQLEAVLSQLEQKTATLHASYDEVLSATPTPSAVAESSESASSACARSQERSLLAACLGWQPVTLTSTAIELRFAAGVHLTASLATGADRSLRLRSPPAIERRPVVSGADEGLGSMLADLAVSEVAREAASCVHLNALPALVTKLGTLCSRAVEVQSEVSVLSAPYEVQCTREPVIVGGRPGSAPVLTIAFSFGAHRLRFRAMLRIDTLATPTALSYQRVEVDACPAGLSHGTIANCVLGAMSSTERVAMLRLTALCAAVHEAADKACKQLAV